MSTFREQKRAARRQVHEVMAEPVLYLESAATKDPVVVTCRLHINFTELGDLLGVRAGFAERQETTPRVIFMNDQVVPVSNAIIITKDMGAFRINNDLPPDDITTTAEVTEVMEREVVRYGWNPKALWLGFPAPAGS